EGFVRVDEPTFRASRQLVLEPWDSVKGQVRAGDAPYARGLLVVKVISNDEQDTRVEFEFNAMTNAQGDFALDRVPAGKLLIARPNPNNNLEVAGSNAQAFVEVNPGQ